MTSEDTTSSAEGSSRADRAEPALPEAFDETLSQSRPASSGSDDPSSSSWAPEREDVEVLRRKAMVAAALFDEPLTPIKIGRYTIVRELGAGGMGVVYVAYDEQLDRRVAVKLLRSDTDSKAQLRLHREAQAMARLSHPNVVTVHEVGTFQGQVFVAMEFVEGQDLRRWLTAEQRSWRAIVDAFIQAGEGLAAAHAAGIVHRDFKPDNVLVGNDGRLRVADFGLARAPDVFVSSASVTVDSTDADTQVDATPSDPAQSIHEHRTPRLDDPLTKTGAIMGTPAYMAPEQFEGARTDARTDQFSFCVALYEGLYGRRPFTAQGMLALSLAVREGRIDEPSEPVDVPAWLRAIVLRGLSPAPADRWPSMRALLDALAMDPQARRTRLLRRGALAMVVAAALGGLAWLTASEVRFNARQRYWNGFTEQMLGIERERGVRQANDDALRARDATRMSVYRSYRPKEGVVDHEDPTVAAVLLREVEGSARASEAWISAANQILGRPISRAVLTGHRDAITALAFAPDPNILYSGSMDGEVRRWDIASGRSELITAHANDVNDLALSPDGRMLVSASKDGSVRSWSVDSPEPAQTLVRHEGEVMKVAFSRDGRRLVSAGKDGTARVRDFSTDSWVTLVGHSGAVYSAEFDASGEHVVTASADRSARVWRVVDGRTVSELLGHEQAVFHARFVDERRVVTGSDDGTIRLWQLAGDSLVPGEVLVRHTAAITSLDLHEHRFVSAAYDGGVIVGSLEAPYVSNELEGQGAVVWAAIFSPSGAQVVTASFDTTARRMSADGRGVAEVFKGHRQGLIRSVIDRSGRWLATGSYDGSVRVWDLERPRLEIPLLGHERAVYSVAFDSSGERAVSVSRDGTARLWDAKDGTHLAKLDGGHGSLDVASFSPDGQTLVTATKQGIVELWDLETQQLRSLEGHHGVVWSVSFDASGELLGSASVDGTARVWNVASGDELLTLRGHTDAVHGVDFEPGGARVVTASRDGTLRLWSRADGAEQAVLRGHTGSIWMMVRSPDGRTLATASEDGTARLWPDDRPEHAIVLRGHVKPVWSVAFDRLGTRVVTSSFDGTARVWNSEDGSLLATLTGHAEVVWRACFTPDGRVTTVSDDNTIRVWSPGSDALPIVLTGHGDGVTGLAISPEGDRMLTGSADATAKLWRLDLLSSEPDVLHERLVEVTRFCLPAEQRVRELGEDPGEAEASSIRCEQARGR